jgi:hypothetical protein
LYETKISGILFKIGEALIQKERKLSRRIANWYFVRTTPSALPRWGEAKSRGS